MKVLVTGGSGQLGTEVCKYLRRKGFDVFSPSRQEMNVTDALKVLETVKRICPDIVIHCAAYTQVDQAEEHREEAFLLNESGTANIAAACLEIAAKMIYISTDYVFSGIGNSYYEIDDPTEPLNVYGLSKLAGENRVRNLLERYFIVRISWLYGHNGDNFVEKILRAIKEKERIQVACDQVGSPTYAKDLPPLLHEMMMSEEYGTYHATNAGICTRAEFATEIIGLTGRKIEVQPILTENFQSCAQRPLNSKLSKASLKEHGFKDLRDWKSALYDYYSEEHLS